MITALHPPPYTLSQRRFPLDRICILIPAYNAQNTLGGVLEKTRPLQIDTIVVNDGSSDETRRIAGEFGARILEHPFNLGKGGALRTGFRYALDKGYEIVITLDADGQHDPSEIPSLIRIFESVKPDFLIGSRAEEFGRMPFLRRFWNRLGARAVARLCHSDIRDSQSGYRVIRTEVLEEIELTTLRFEAELELLIKACKRGFGVLSVPINAHRIDGTKTSHFRPVADTWKVCKLFLRSLLW
jgi:glycosyltransferase involved in cell wall biosynthesis